MYVHASSHGARTVEPGTRSGKQGCNGFGSVGRQQTTIFVDVLVESYVSAQRVVTKISCRFSSGIDTRITQVWYVPVATVVWQLAAVAPCVCITTAHVARNSKALRERARCCEFSWTARRRIRRITAACSSEEERDRLAVIPGNRCAPG